MTAKATPGIRGRVNIEGRSALIVERTASPMPCPTFLGEGDATILGNLKDADITDNSVNNILFDHITKVCIAKLGCISKLGKY